MVRVSEVLYVGLAQMSMVIGTLIATKLLTNILTPAEYARIVLALSLAAVVQMIFNAFANSLIRYLPIAELEGQLQQYRKSIDMMMAISAVIVFVSSIFWIFIMHLLSIDLQLHLILAVIFATLSGWVAWYQSVLTAMRERGEVFVVVAINYLFRPLLAGVFIIIMDGRAEIAIAAYILTQLIIYPYASGKVIRHAAKSNAISSSGIVRADYLPEFVSYSGYFLVSGVFVAMITQADRWILHAYIDAGDLAGYAAVLSIATGFVSLGHNFIVQLLTPIVFERATLQKTVPNRSINALAIMVWSALIIFLFIFFLTYWFGTSIVALLTSEYYAGYAGLLPILTMGLAIERLGQIITTKGFVQLKTWRYLISRIIQAISMIGFSLYLVTLHGAYGVALAIFISSVVYIAFVLITNALFLEIKKT